MLNPVTIKVARDEEIDANLLADPLISDSYLQLVGARES